MKKFVVDSSVILKWLYREDERYLDQADQILKDAVDRKISLLTTELAKYEVGNVLLIAKKLPEKLGDEALETFYSLPIQFLVQTESLSKVTYKIGLNAKITFYDAAFAALAKREDAILVTDNPKHQTKIKGVKVVPLEKYR